MNDLGKQGEQLALETLLKKGYVLLYKNWKAGYKEIDLIVENDDFLVFVEVKTRKTDRFGKPEAAVHTKKKKHLIQAAKIYCRKYRPKKEVRFDIIAITFLQPATNIKHIENAFFPEYYI